MKNAYLVCMLAFLGLGLADLFYLNSRILPAIWTEDKAEMAAQDLVPPEIYRPDKNDEATVPINEMSDEMTVSENSAPEEAMSQSLPQTVASVGMEETDDSDRPNTPVAETMPPLSANLNADSNDKDLETNEINDDSLSTDVDMEASTAGEERQKEPTLIKKVIVHFESSSFKLTLKERRRLLSEVSDLLPNKDIQVYIDGHSDQSGAGVFDNEHLSKQRADYVAKFLKRKGIVPNNIIAEGFGYTKPLDSADTPEALAKNRRAEIKLFEVMP